MFGANFKKGFEYLLSPPERPKILSTDEAIKQAWVQVGDSMREAMGTYNVQQQQQEQQEEQREQEE